MAEAEVEDNEMEENDDQDEEELEHVRPRRDPFTEYTDAEFLKRYRFSKENVRNLEIRLRPHLAGGRGRAIPPILQVTTALRFYATNDIQLVDSDLLGVSQQTVSRIVQKVSIAICRLRAEFINFPNDLYDVKQNFFNISGFPEVIWAIDGTHIPIKSPGGDNAELFRNRKGYFSINVQAIVDSACKFTDIVVRWPGSTHDATMFNNSGSF